MGKDGRIIEVDKDGYPWGIIIFSLCNDYEPFYKKYTWKYLKHDRKGHIAYIEKMACYGWSKELRKAFEERLVAKYPNIEQAIWHRYGKTGDRTVIYRRKVCMK